MKPTTYQSERLPQCGIGKSGRDLFTSAKELTIVLLAYDCYSVFPKIVDKLYEQRGVPFNLIVVEANAPGQVRLELEKRQWNHESMSILYSRDRLSLAEAYNLALPHIKTHYALIISNRIDPEKMDLGEMIEYVSTGKAEALLPYQEGDFIGFAVLDWFMLSRAAMKELGRLEAHLTPVTAGLELIMLMRLLKIPFAQYEAEEGRGWDFSRVRRIDKPLYSFQWSPLRIRDSIEILERKWSLSISGEDQLKHLSRHLKSLHGGRRPYLNKLSEKLGRILGYARKSGLQSLHKRLPLRSRIPFAKPPKQ